MKISTSDILHGKILIVDDQEANVLLLDQMLRDAGYDSITSTMDPNEVFPLHLLNHFDLILLDLKMPGMDGFQVMEKLKTIEAGSYLPVLAISAQPDYKLRVLKAGAKDFISKPYDIAELLLRVYNMLEVRLLNIENENRAADLIIAEKELKFQNSEKEKRASELLIANAFLENLINYASAPIIVWDPQFLITRFNHAFEALTGRSEAEVMGQSVSILFPPSLVGSSLELIDRTSVTERWEAVEIIIIHRDGSLRTVLWNSATILCPDGRTPMATIAQGLDITNRKLADEEKSRLQTQLAHSQTLDSLGLLAGGVAHDMNNVLGAILGMATANLEAHPEGSPTYLAFEIIIKAAERGGKMVKSLLNFARQDPVEVSELDMNAILLEEVRILERTTLSKVLLKMDMASELRRIRGDASALSHAFMNLCINSVDAMSEKGTLTLRTRNVDNNWIEVVVEDTGVGMPKDILEKAMVPFFTTKGVGKGTGLGLSMVYSAVKAHNGQLDIQSEPGKGTQVRLRFPASDTILQTAESPATPPPKPSIMALKVLVVDDDELIRYTIQSMLKSMGHRVTLATSGEDALEKLEAGFQPDLIFLDMNMPGLGGAGTLPRLRALCPTLPVLLATGRVDQATLNLVAAHPYVTLMSKPFTMKELQKHLGH